MKKGVMNYSLTWMEYGNNQEAIIFSKKEAVKMYIDLLSSHGNISSLKFWECYTTMKPAKDITTAVNRFLA